MHFNKNINIDVNFYFKFFHYVKDKINAFKRNKVFLK